MGTVLNAGVTVFNWHRIRNNIISADLTFDAAKMDVEKIKNDISDCCHLLFTGVVIAPANSH